MSIYSHGSTVPYHVPLLIRAACQICLHVIFHNPPCRFADLYQFTWGVFSPAWWVLLAASDSVRRPGLLAAFTGHSPPLLATEQCSYYFLLGWKKVYSERKEHYLLSYPVIITCPIWGQDPLWCCVVFFHVFMELLYPCVWMEVWGVFASLN